MTTEVYETPDGHIVNDPVEAAELWAHECRLLRKKVKELDGKLSWWQDADPIINDAERYRWLRDIGCKSYRPFVISWIETGGTGEVLTAKQVDKIIDKAMKDD